MATLTVGSLGEFIRDQRRGAEYSLRQLAAAAGVSNPYLSQIERGLKKPSAEVLQSIAKALQISAETLYVRAGFLEDRGNSSDVVAAVLGDSSIGERHKRVLIDIYESFRHEHAGAPVVAPGSTSGAAATRTTKKTTNARKPSARKTNARKPSTRRTKS